MKKFNTIIIGLLSFSLSMNAQNTLLVHEPFDYAPLNPLNWAASEEEGWNGEWIRAIGDDIVMRAGNLDYNNWGDEAGSHLSVDITNVGTRYNRKILSIPDTGQVVWASVMMNFPAGTPPNNVGNITLTKSGNQLLSFGRKYGNETFGLVFSNANNYNTAISTEGLHWLVLKIRFSGNNGPENIFLWIDPDPSTEPDEATADIAVLEDSSPSLRMNFGFDGIQIKAEGTPPILMDVDELRISNFWEAANPFLVSSIAKIQEQNDFSVYPNPVREELIIKWLYPPKESLTLQLLTLEGKIVSTWQIPSYRNKMVLPLQELHLTTGVYLLHLQGKEGRGSKKIYVISE